MDILGKIFGKPARVRIMRLFLFNQDTPFTVGDVAKRTRTRKDSTRLELKRLEKIGMLSPKSWKEKSSTKKKKTVKGFVLNTKFSLIRPLQNLLIDTELVSQKDIVSRIRQSGKVDLLLLSGIFTRDENRALDVLVVGNKLDQAVLGRQIAILESEIGRELAYAHFDVDEFNYRMGMYDKLLRDVLENHHEVLVNKIID
jgi:hypothetical protein